MFSILAHSTLRLCLGSTILTLGTNSAATVCFSVEVRASVKVATTANQRADRAFLVAGQAAMDPVG